MPNTLERNIRAAAGKIVEIVREAQPVLCNAVVEADPKAYFTKPDHVEAFRQDQINALAAWPPFRQAIEALRNMRGMPEGWTVEDVMRWSCMAVAALDAITGRKETT